MVLGTKLLEQALRGDPLDEWDRRQLERTADELFNIAERLRSTTNADFVRGVARQLNHAVNYAPTTGEGRR